MTSAVLGTDARPRRATSVGPAPTYGKLLLLGAAVWGLAIGLTPLHDNSFLTHLATGRLILDGGIPHADPYSFTATGTPWVVQSWLASLVYGVADRLGEGFGLLAVHAALTTTLAVLVVRLARPCDGLLGRTGLVALAVGVGTGIWSERPLLIGLVLLAIVLLAAEDRVDPRWLVPVMWVWANAHGSFPLGLVALAALAAGRRLDGRHPRAELRALRWAVLGTALAVVNPLGPRLLLFPLELLGRTEALEAVLEWQAPRFTTTWERLYLLQVLVAVVALVRRPSWRAAVPAVLFVAASLVASRNIAVASLVLLPGTARGLAGMGQLAAAQRLRAGRLVYVPLVLLAALLLIAASGRTAFRLDGYPVAALEWMESEGLLGHDARVVAEDFVGNYRTALDGAAAGVFVDDRYDMYPQPVIDDYLVLKRGRPGWDDVLERWGTTAVLWDRDLPLAELVRASDRWRIVHQDDAWVVAVPR